MSLTATKILYGPFDLDLIDGTVSQLARTGLVMDSVVFNGNVDEGEETIEDGSKLYWKEGRELIVEITFSELDPTATTGDLAKIEDAEDIVTAGSFTTGRRYRIVSVGDTDFTTIGAASNTVGIEFTTTGAGTGTGTAAEMGVGKLTLAFTNPSKTITIDDLDHVSVNIEDLKTKIICKKSKPTGQDWSDVFSST